MANLVKDITTYETKVYKISGPLAMNMDLSRGQGAIEIGQVLSYDENTGKLVKYEKGVNTAFSIALSDVDSSLTDAKVLVAIPNTVFNKLEVKGTDLETDFTVIKELWANGITLKEVE